jgi:predicted TIM-barrel fold metal-dependent hydrolase
MSVPPLITLEEHFVSTHLLSYLSEIYSEQLIHLPDVKAKLLDVGDLRLQDMDLNQVSFQIVSHGPGAGTLPLNLCQQANDQLRESIKLHPSRFAGFAVLPMSTPEDAAAELRRCVRELGFVGALVDNHVNGKHYDEERYWPVLEAAEELDVPFYLHPHYAAGPQKIVYEGNFSLGAEKGLGSSSFGWHQDCGLHVLKLFAAGVFDKYPKLKIIIGHFGEMLPFMLERIEKLCHRWGKRERSFRQVWDTNLWITTSGVWSLAPLACILQNTKMDRILYSVDYPFEKNENGLKWIKELQKSGLVTPEQLEMIAYHNAEKLLGVKAPCL